ncbi:hypothetical protein EDD37DRAFT_655002 [Exophiala viscosa]|uniref:uncharacterized protein n=1 Tax=Exophiala viscosa TaxID=2486360 RepID=UPI00219A52A2|nr:hypothetical protein EDD37DRAFT_655002 [Exophiala viscosa]
MAKPTVTLIPWDPYSPKHVKRMVEQRIVCGWHAPIVATEWKDGHINGTKCIYWIIFPQDEPEREKYLKMHIKAYPKETEELVDSSKTLLGNPRVPTNVKLLPVGHIALGLGVGGAAMNIAERMATEEPLNARHLLLDTVDHDDQSDKDFAIANYGGEFKIPTQAWYERRGYRLIGTVENLYQDPDPNGKIWPSRTVFLQKDIV